MKINRSNTLSGSIALLGFGLLMFLITFGMSIVDWTKDAVNLGFLGNATLHLPVFADTAANVVFYLLIPFPGVLCIERGIYDFRRAINTRKDEMKSYPKSVWSKFAVFTKYYDFVGNVLLAIILSALAALCIYVLAMLKLRFTVFTLLYLMPIVVYVLFRKKLSKGLKKAVLKLRKGYPSFTLAEDSIEMRLFPVGKSQRAVNPPPVRLYFSELDEVKTLTDVEADNYMKYTVGPDFALSQRMIEGRIQYLKGEIARPPVFKSATCTGSLSVLFRGKDLFYLITFETDEVEGIEKAFEAYKRLHPQAG